MLLPENIQRLNPSTRLDMPEGPAVARGRGLERGANLVDRPGVRLAGDRAVGTHFGSPAALRIRQTASGRDKPDLHQHAERNARLLALVGYGSHGALVERQGRSDPLLRDLHISRLTLDADPAPPKPTRNRAGRARAEKWIEHHVARLRAGQQDAVEQGFGLLRRMGFRPVVALHSLAAAADRQIPVRAHLE